MVKTKQIITHHYPSPFGEMILGAIDDELCLCDWTAGRRRDIIDRRLCRRLNAAMVDGNSSAIDVAVGQLDEYFAGERRVFTLPFRFAGSDFQCRVWSELLKIPYGETITYAEQARRAGNPNAVRAVASANAVNALSIIVPCHRVIGTDGRLTGYGGGLEVKRQLIESEGRVNKM